MNSSDLLNALRRLPDTRPEPEPFEVWRDACGLAFAAADEIERLRGALTELRDRIKGHPEYEDLTEEGEIETGGGAAELSYLARVADAALGPDAASKRTATGWPM
jgi:hypothetical protein